MVEIRPATTGDFARIAELTLAAYAQGLPPDAEYRHYLADVAGRADAPTEIWVASADEAVVGSVTWCPPGSPHRDVAGPDDGEFRTLAVDPASAGRGIGRALVTAVITRARHDGLAGIALTTAPWMTTAHLLYASLGFVRTPELDWNAGDMLLLTYRLDLTR